MNSILRSALNLKHRFHLALEDDTGTAAVEAPADDTVVMKGPLSANYADALDAIYNKEVPLPVAADNGDPTARTEPPAETGENVDPAAIVPTPGVELDPVEAATTIPEITQVVLESQAVDAAVVQALQAASTDEEEVQGQNYATFYAIDETQITPEKIVEVTTILSEAEHPDQVSVLIDDVLPADPTVTIVDGAANQTKELALGLESIVTAMGGKVYRTFGAYVASRRK